MNKKSFFWGVLTGVALSILLIFVLSLVYNNMGVDKKIDYLERPISYENKIESSFEVFQVLGNDAALAREVSDGNGYITIYMGNTVLLIGENFYSNQVVHVRHPQRIGTYQYTNNGGMPMTVPVIEGEMY